MFRTKTLTLKTLGDCLRLPMTSAISMIIILSWEVWIFSGTTTSIKAKDTNELRINNEKM